ncbi:MAG: hypothetical protein V4480_04120 [Patescibacteria group bacterium]
MSAKPVLFVLTQTDATCFCLADTLTGLGAEVVIAKLDSTIDPARYDKYEVIAMMVNSNPALSLAASVDFPSLAKVDARFPVPTVLGCFLRGMDVRTVVVRQSYVKMVPMHPELLGTLAEVVGRVRADA